MGSKLNLRHTYRFASRLAISSWLSWSQKCAVSQIVHFITVEDVVYKPLSACLVEEKKLQWRVYMSHLHHRRLNFKLVGRVDRPLGLQTLASSRGLRLLFGSSACTEHPTNSTLCVSPTTWLFIWYWGTVYLYVMTVYLYDFLLL